MPRTATLSAILSLLLLSATHVTASIGHSSHGQGKSHARRADHVKRQELAQRAEEDKREVFTTGNVTIMERGVEGRDFTGTRATFYDIGLGACGQYNNEPDFIVALNTPQYGGGYPGPECFKYITIYGGSRNGRAVAQIMDQCPGCPYGGLDMSRALFQQFASLDEGVATVSWFFNDGSGSGGATTTTTSTTPAYTPPSTSSTPAYTPPATSTTPTSTYTPPTTSAQPTTTSTSTTASSVSLTSSIASMSSASTGSFRNATATSSNAWVAQITAGTNSTTNSNSTITTNPGSTDGTGNGDVTGSRSNLEMLGTLTAQFGGLVVQAAQAGA